MIAAGWPSVHAQSNQPESLESAIHGAQTRVVKIYGAGGVRRMEAYQSGILFTSEGHVLTAMSYVLDTDNLLVVLNDGRRLTAQFIGSDPVTELAILKLPVDGEELKYFDLAGGPQAELGMRILAVSNLFGIATGDEPVSVLQGVVTAIVPLDARRGAFQSNYRGRVYVVDAYSNNPGAAGGALVDWEGHLLGILGREFRSRVTGTWLNYALPADVIRHAAEEILEGRQRDPTEARSARPEEPLSARALGLALVPNVLLRTPPYLDGVLQDSPADRAGLQADDLVVMIDGTPTGSCQAVDEALGQCEASSPVRISVLRKGKVLEVIVEVKPSGDGR
jgi:S1-C subfamily serine protease